MVSSMTLLFPQMLSTAFPAFFNLQSVLALALLLSVVAVCALLAAFWFNPYLLRHVQVFQVLRAQMLRPYSVKSMTANKIPSDETVVSPVYTNQLGNNLFQYCYAKIYAECTDARFESMPLNQDVFGSKKTSVDALQTQAAPFDKIDLSQPSHLAAPIDDETRARFLSQRPNNFAQDVSLFDGFEDRVRDWLEPSVESHEDAVKHAIDVVGVRRPGTAVIHLRFAAAHEGLLYADPTYHSLPTSYYHHSLLHIQSTQQTSLEKVVVVHGPKCDAEVLAVITELSAQWPNTQFVRQSANRTEDFVVMYCASALVISVSTFAWWAAFLGDRSKTVCFPRQQLHGWRRTGPFPAIFAWFNKLLPSDAQEPHHLHSAPPSLGKPVASSSTSFRGLAIKKDISPNSSSRALNTLATGPSFLAVPYTV